jgi:ribonuclease HII
MAAYEPQYPEYHFAENAGYGTRHHLNALRDHGACPTPSQNLPWRPSKPDNSLAIGGEMI